MHAYLYLPGSNSTPMALCMSMWMHVHNKTNNIRETLILTCEKQTNKQTNKTCEMEVLKA